MAETQGTKTSECYIHRGTVIIIIIILEYFFCTLAKPECQYRPSLLVIVVVEQTRFFRAPD
jgi:hypothetical protein